MNKVLIILRKEWLEIKQQRALLFTVILPPLLFTLMPIVALFIVGQIPSTGGRGSSSLAKVMPALALIGIALMVAVSSRVNDPRTAQQFSAVLVLPFLGLFIGQISGLLILGPVFALTVFLILLALVVLAIWIVTQLFQREVILT